MANGYIGDRRIRPMETLMRKLCQQKGYDLDTAFKGLLDYLLWLFDPEGNKPEGWRFDSTDSKMFYDMSLAYFQMMHEELENGTEWYDAFGDLYMALHPGGGGKAQFFTPPCLCQITAELCIDGKDVVEAEGLDTTFGKRVCINDPAAGSSRLLLAGASIFRRLQHDQLGYDEIRQSSRRPYLIAEDLDYNCVKMSAINMAVHGCFGECICHDSLCEPDQVRMGYIVNESMWPFPTNVPSIRRYTDPMRFVATRVWAMKKQLKEQNNGRTNGKATTADSQHRGASERPAGEQLGTGSAQLPETRLPVPTQTSETASDRGRSKEPQQLSLW